MSDEAGMTTTTQQAISYRIADAKARFLEDAIQLIMPVLRNGDEAEFVVEDIEDLTQDTIDLFAALLRCDEQHHLLATLSDQYPYEATEAQLEKLFGRFVTVCDHVHELVEILQDRGQQVKSRHTLKAVCNRAHRLVEDDEAVYETEAFRTLMEEAFADYQAGQVKEWLV
jgi:uncharacterized protein (DUF1778 family)